jgi:uncharacterized membrane protein
MIRRLLQRYFVTGLLTLIPIWLTWIVFKFVFQGLSMVSAPWIRALFNPLARAHPALFGWLASPTAIPARRRAHRVPDLFTGWLRRCRQRLLLLFEQHWNVAHGQDHLAGPSNCWRPCRPSRMERSASC